MKGGQENAENSGMVRIRRWTCNVGLWNVRKRTKARRTQTRKNRKIYTRILKGRKSFFYLDVAILDVQRLNLVVDNFPKIVYTLSIK